ncbi:MAG: hypothetical protein OEY14_00590, partial [Myxococcales bacterium]|nr:hypothetical protein [Myxococcales bacterium]
FLLSDVGGPRGQIRVAVWRAESNEPSRHSVDCQEASCALSVRFDVDRDGEWFFDIELPEGGSAKVAVRAAARAANPDEAAASDEAAPSS